MSRHIISHRHRLGSVGDSAPPSESSEGGTSSSEACDIHHDWSLSEQNHQHNSSSVYTNSEIDDSLSVSTNSASNLSEDEREQVESFFSGLGTEIYVSTALANLYENVGKDDWRLVFTGIPVLLHDKGSARSRSISRVTLCLAERGSSFALWSDTLDNMSSYQIAGPSFHTMCLSSNRNQLIGFSFDSSESAHELYQYIDKLTNNPDLIAMNTPGRKNKTKKQKQKRSKTVPVHISEISYPCQFHHVTSVTRNDSERLFSMQAFLPAAHR